MVYADDFVCRFQYKEEAEAFYERLRHRMGYFGLNLEENKSRLIEFGRYAENNRKRRGEMKPETFTFLGFTHYCSHSAKWYGIPKGRELTEAEQKQIVDVLMTWIRKQTDNGI